MALEENFRNDLDRIDLNIEKLFGTAKSFVNYAMYRHVTLIWG